MDFDCPGIEGYFPREHLVDSKFKEIVEQCKEVIGPLLPMEGINLDCIENEGYFSIDIYRLEFVNEPFLNKILDDPLNYFKYMGVAVLMLYKAHKDSEVEEVASQSQPVKTDFFRRLWFECTGYREIVPIASISPPHYGKFVTISGMVASISAVTETIYEATFRCDKCSALQYVLQPMGQLQTPKTCPSPDCNLQSNNRSATTTTSSSSIHHCTFSRVKNADIKVPSQIITVIQTRYDSKTNEKHVDVIQVQLLNHLIEKCFIMDSVTVSGIIVEPKNIEGTGICSFYMIASSLSQKEEKKFSPNIVKGIKAITDEEDILSLVVASFCPSVSCNNMVKFGLLLSLVGGHDSENVTEDEPIAFRGPIHILLLGAPNKDKKEILNAAHLLAPISSYVDKNYTQNLVYGVKSEKGEDTLHAGPVLQANKGSCCIDDLDSMKSQWIYISEIMEAQMFQVAKNGFVQTLPVEIGIIASSTPAGGAYRAERTLYENIKMPFDMLNHFDLIFHLVDEPDHENDRSFTKMVLKKREGRSSSSSPPPSTSKKSSTFSRNGQSLAKRLNSIDKESIDLLPRKLLSEYITFVRTKIFPIFDEEAHSTICHFASEYQEKAFRGVAGPNIHPNENQLVESIMRLSLARARIESKKVVTKQYVQDVIELIKFTRNDLFPKDVLSSLSSQSSVSSFRRPIESSEGFVGLANKRCRSSNERFVRFLEDYFKENPEREFSIDDLWTIARSGPPVTKFEQLIDYLNLHGYILQCGNSRYRWIASR